MCTEQKSTAVLCLHQHKGVRAALSRVPNKPPASLSHSNLPSLANFQSKSYQSPIATTNSGARSPATLTHHLSPTRMPASTVLRTCVHAGHPCMQLLLHMPAEALPPLPLNQACSTAAYTGRSPRRHRSEHNDVQKSHDSSGILSVCAVLQAP
jgi:hypothetical protein